MSDKSFISFVEDSKNYVNMDNRAIALVYKFTGEEKGSRELYSPTRRSQMLEDFFTRINNEVFDVYDVDEWVECTGIDVPNAKFLVGRATAQAENKAVYLLLHDYDADFDREFVNTPLERERELESYLSEVALIIDLHDVDDWKELLMTNNTEDVQKIVGFINRNT